MPHRRLEEVAMNAWPALHQILVDGWVLRFAHGYTKRANSVNPLYDSSMAVEAKIDLCEQLYAAHGLPTVFRLMPQASPPDLDQVLEQRGYRRVEPSLVMRRDLQHVSLPARPSVVLHEEAVADWVRLYSALSGAAPDTNETHARLLERIPASRLLVSLRQAGRVVACGTGVLEHDAFGLFSLVTAPEQSHRGYGTQLVCAMLHWAQARGASQAYLQVLASNTPARHVYTRLGFQEAYPYWYRVP